MSLSDISYAKVSNKTIRQLLIFAACFFVAFILVQLADNLRGKNIVITFDSKQADSIQVFYPVNGGAGFIEESSERYAYDKGARRSLAFSYPNSSRTIRIDPSDGAGELVLREIEINRLFAKTILYGEDLFSRMQAVQSIERIEVSNENVLIRSDAVDPIILLDLSNLEGQDNFITSIWIALSIALFGYCLLGSIFSPSFRRELSIIIIPFLLTFALVSVFFPGYMTYDSLHALRSARNGVNEFTWPPMVSYVWRGVDAIFPHPSAMLFGQVLILLLSTSSIIFYYTKSVRYVVLSLGLILSVPVILGTVSAIWKDVLMASFFVAAFYFMLRIKEEKNVWKVSLNCFISLFLLFLATASRHNAVVATLPLVFYLVWLVTGALNVPRRVAVSLVVGMLILGSLLGLKIQFDKYAIPGFTPISGTNNLIPVVRTMDVIAASICANENLFGSAAYSLSIQEMISGYDARHSNLSLGIINKIPPAVDINSAWISAFKRHPGCFFSNKFLLAKYLLGANSGEQFLVISPQVDFNEYGYYLPKNPFRQTIERYVFSASGKVFYRPWFLSIVTALTLFGVAFLRKGIKLDYFVLWLSATFYAFGLFLFGNAADARLLFFTNYVYSVVFFLLLFELVISRDGIQKYSCASR